MRDWLPGIEAMLTDSPLTALLARSPAQTGASPCR